MNNLDRLLAAFERAPLDRLPWAPDLGYWIDAERARGTLPAEYEGREGQRRLYVDLDALVYYGDGTSPAICRSDGVSVSTEVRGEVRVDRFECDGRVLER